jgi:hypothetical protein
VQAASRGSRLLTVASTVNFPVHYSRARARPEPVHRMDQNGEGHQGGQHLQERVREHSQRFGCGDGSGETKERRETLRPLDTPLGTVRLLLRTRQHREDLHGGSGGADQKGKRWKSVDT